jgi:hypothetical protein
MNNSAASKLKQVPAEYLIVGIDPHKKKHAAVSMTQDYNISCKFKFNNDQAGFITALERDAGKKW